MNCPTCRAELHEDVVAVDVVDRAGRVQEHWHATGDEVKDGLALGAAINDLLADAADRMLAAATEEQEPASA